MQTHAIEFGRHKPHSSGHPFSHATQVGGKFALVHARSSGDPKHDAIVKQAQKWVSQTFYGEMLKQMRNSPFKSKIFSGGEGGQAFTQMFDQRLADKMATGSGQKLVNAIVKKIEGAKAYSTQTARPMGNKIKPQAMSPTLRHNIGAAAADPSSERPHRIAPLPLSPTLRHNIGESA